MLTSVAGHRNGVSGHNLLPVGQRVHIDLVVLEHPVGHGAVLVPGVVSKEQLALLGVVLDDDGAGGAGGAGLLLGSKVDGGGVPAAVFDVIDAILAIVYDKEQEGRSFR